MPALAVAAWLRLDGDAFRVIDPMAFVQFCGLAVVLQLVIGSLATRVRGWHFTGAIDDAVHMSAVLSATGTVLFLVGLSGVIPLPRSLALIATLVAIALTVGLRVLLQISRERRSRPDAATAERVIVFGAGSGGQQIVRSMLGDAGSGYLPVALIDDDPSVVGRRIAGIAVQGTRTDVAEVAFRTRAELLVVAIPSLDLGAMREVSQAATQAGLRVKAVPPLMELFRPWINVSDIRDLDIADLIGRKPVEIDIEAVAGYLKGKKVLVTGAGGSIGSELCRQVRHFSPAALVMLDRDESALHALQLSIEGKAMLDSPDVVLADIRDAPTLTGILRERRPDVVFHAAALKHLPMLEQYPHEAWQSNVIGTANVLAAAAAANVAMFVNISTDKAANPTSVLGMSKRIGERLVADTARCVEYGTYVSVRFGNVLGSRGSVLSTFAEQIAKDQPITVTHPDVTRFFMTIPEAVRLVVQAAAIGRPGEALVLDMGAPVRIVDIARHLTVLAGRPVQILYTGLRDGEKLNEELFGDGESDVRPIHPAVSHVHVPALDITSVPFSITPLRAAPLMRRLVTDGAEPDPTRTQPDGLHVVRSGWTSPADRIATAEQP